MTAKKVGVKICGITTLEDAVHASTCGADWIGFVFAESRRRCPLRRAARISAAMAVSWPSVGRVGVFVDPSPGEIAEAARVARLTHVQIHGVAPSRRIDDLPTIRAIPLASPEDARWPDSSREPEPWAVLVEPKKAGYAGGTGTTFPWAWAEPLLARGRVFVAGGLHAGLVRELLLTIRPFALDASSGLEAKPGVKDPVKVVSFLLAVDLASRPVSLS